MIVMTLAFMARRSQSSMSGPRQPPQAYDFITGGTAGSGPLGAVGGTVICHSPIQSLGTPYLTLR